MLCSHVLVLHSNLNRTNSSLDTVGAQYSYQSTHVKPSIPYWNRVPNRVLCQTGFGGKINSLPIHSTLSFNSCHPNGATWKCSSYTFFLSFMKSNLETFLCTQVFEYVVWILNYNYIPVGRKGLMPIYVQVILS